jgi:hypothetical protein
MALIQLAQFNNTGRYRSILLTTGSIFAGFGFFLIGAVLAGTGDCWLQKLPIPKILGYLGSALLIPAAGFLSAGMVAAARHQHLAAQLGESAAKMDMTDPPDTALDPRGEKRFAVWPPRFSSSGAEELAGWPQVLVAMALAISAMLGVIEVWRASCAPALDASMQQVIGGLLLVGAFPLLVLERSYGNIAVRTLPEAPQLNRLLRVALTAFAGFGVAMILSSLGFVWPLQLESAIAALILLVSAELAFRGFATLFVPLAPLPERRPVADSSIAGLLRLGIPRFNSLNATVQRRFGIDLSRSWALAFVGRALPPPSRPRSASSLGA